MTGEEIQFFFYDLCQFLLNGIAQGSIYALIALGYTMVYGIIKLINFAHGEFYMIGAFIGYYVCRYLISVDMDPALALLIGLPLAMIGSGTIAVVVEKLVYRPIRGHGRITPLITALGASLFFQYLGQGTVGAEPKAFPSLISSDGIGFFDDNIFISYVQMLIMALTLLIMTFLWWLVTHTKIGKAMRATSYNRNAAELMGIDTDKVISFTFFLGASLAGATGVLVGMYYNTVEPMMGLIPGLKAFIAAVLGGIGIIPGAALGGLVLGIAENLVVGFWISTYRDAVAFAILILILLIKPAGLLGKNVKEKV